MSLQPATINGPEPVSLQEAKNHCYVTSNDEDSLISTCITAAREYAENRLWRAIVPVTYKLRLDEFPDVVELPRPPCIAVDSIQYVDGNGVLQTLDASKYEVDTESEPARVKPVNGWPSVKSQYNAIIITFSAGYDGSSVAYEVPKQIKQGLLMMIKHLFDNREMIAITEGRSLSVEEVPMTTKHLLEPYSMRSF